MENGAIHISNLLSQAQTETNQALEQEINESPKPEETTTPGATPETTPQDVVGDASDLPPEDEPLGRFAELKKNWRVPTPQECKRSNRILEGQGATVDWEAFGDFDELSELVGTAAEELVGKRVHRESGMVYKLKLQPEDKRDLAKGWSNIFFNISRTMLKSSPLGDLMFAAWKTKSVMENVARRAEQNPAAYIEVLGYQDPETNEPEEPTHSDLEVINEKQKEEELAKAEEAKQPKKRGRPRGRKDSKPRKPRETK